MAPSIPGGFADFAESTAQYLHAIEAEFDVAIQRIALDAPSDPKPNGELRRKSEAALDERGISCFATPSADEFTEIRRSAEAHLKWGGREACLPHANQLWMLVGFGLFFRLRKEWECLEVYPQATVAILGCSGVHKAKDEGLLNQFRAAQALTLWPDKAELEMLRPTGHGELHDCLDAYLAAWVASLPDESREALGTPPFDAIWVPRRAGPSNCGLQQTWPSLRSGPRS